MKGAPPREGLLDDMRKNLMGAYDLPEMRLESNLWVRIPILGLFYASEANKFGYQIGYFRRKSVRKFCSILFLFMFFIEYAGLTLRQYLNIQLNQYLDSLKTFFL